MKPKTGGSRLGEPRRFLFALILVFALSHPLRGKEFFIQEEFIQELNLAPLTSFPGVTSPAPLFFQIAAGRLWLTWPEALISLTMEGEADARTLLAYHVSRSAETEWNPSAGVLGSDGLRRHIMPERGILNILDPFTGRLSQTPLPPSIQHSPRPELLLRYDKRFWTLENDGGKPRPPDDLPKDITASENDKLAWYDAKKGLLHMGRLTDLESFRTRPLSAPLVLAWAGDLLACGYADRILLLDSGARAAGTWNFKKRRGWYFLQGAPQRLYLLNPAGGSIILAHWGHSRSEITATHEKDVLDRLLLRQVLNAGDFLESNGQNTAALSFYGWALPLIRERRSRDPLNEHWPRLERELNTRKNNLRL